MVKAMEFIARQINDEDILMYWLTMGVADGDLKYGDFSVNTDVDTIDAAGDYCDDDDYFSELMQTFLVCMQAATKSGGLYCDDVVSDFHDEPMM
jgi:hypothetical protein